MNVEKGLISNIPDVKLQKAVGWVAECSVDLTDDFDVLQGEFDRHLAEERQRQEAAIKQAMEVGC